MTFFDNKRKEAWAAALHVDGDADTFEEWLALEGVTPAANETARAAQSAQTRAAFEARELAHNENARIQERLDNA